MRDNAEAGTQGMGVPDVPPQDPSEEGVMAASANNPTVPPAPYAWRVIDATDPKEIPNQPGCYVVTSGKTVVYVGQSSNLRQRVGSYRIRPGYGGVTELVTPWGYLADALVRVKVGRRYGDWLMREARMIKRLQPTDNWMRR